MVARFRHDQLRPADPADMLQALAFALRYQGHGASTRPATPRPGFRRSGWWSACGLQGLLLAYIDVPTPGNCWRLMEGPHGTRTLAEALTSEVLIDVAVTNDLFQQAA